MKFDDYELSDRQKMILKAVVDSHIELGEPVGSKYLTQNKHINYSSATIRNEMAELEEMGLLEQPHTSAGRIPSEAGYRYYVNSLIDEYNFTQHEIDELKSALRTKQTELDMILGTALRLAAKLTNYTALAIKPRQLRITVSRFEIMILDKSSMLLIMLIGSTVKTKHIKCAVEIPSDASVKLASVLNAKITGLTADEITMPLIMEMERMMGEYDFLVTPVIKGVCETITAFDGGDLKFEGVSSLLSYPEFYDTDRLREMLAMFERKDDLLEAISQEALDDKGDNKVHIYIGTENVVKIMDNSTLIFKTVKDNGVPVGAIGIIGPTRMDYRRVIAMIDRMTDAVGNAVHGQLSPPNDNKEQE